MRGVVVLLRPTNQVQPHEAKAILLFWLKRRTLQSIILNKINVRGLF